MNQKEQDLLPLAILALLAILGAAFMYFGGQLREPDIVITAPAPQVIRAMPPRVYEPSNLQKSASLHKQAGKVAKKAHPLPSGLCSDCGAHFTVDGVVADYWGHWE